MMFSTTYPAPANDFPKQPIVVRSDYDDDRKLDRLVRYSRVVCNVQRGVDVEE